MDKYELEGRGQMAYLVVTIRKILDQEAFDEYAERVRPILQQYDGWWVAIEAQHVDTRWHVAVCTHSARGIPIDRSSVAVVRLAGIPRDHPVAAARD